MLYVKKARLFVTTVALGLLAAACGDSPTNPVVPPVTGQPGLVQPVNGCVPIQTNIPINFSGQGAYVDQVNIIGGKIPSIAGYFGSVNRDVGTIVVGGPEVPAVAGPNISLGSGPDGMISIAVNTTTNPYTGTPPANWYQNGQYPFVNPAMGTGGYNNGYNSYPWFTQAGQMTANFSGTLRLSEAVVQDIRYQRQIRGKDANVCVSAIGVDVGRGSSMFSGAVGYSFNPSYSMYGAGGERIYGGRVYLWLNDQAAGGNYILYF